MREIKFRWFNKRTKELIKDAHTLIYPDGSIGLDSPSMDSEWIIFGGQYTGLKDKNGVEIYEGDIYTNGIFNYIVSFNNGAFCGGLIDSDVSPLGFHCEFDRNNSMFTGEIETSHFVNDIEVIGNIHQNPELLTGKQLTK